MDEQVATAGVDFLYRIFCVRDQMPPIEKLLARLTSGNPYNPPGSFIFPPGKGMRRLQDALGASEDFNVMGYQKDEAPALFDELEAALPDQAKGFEEQDRMIVRDARLAVVLRAQIKAPDNNDFVETLVHLADTFRELLLGIVWDVRMEKIWGHEEWRQRVMEEPFSVLNHVAVRVLPPAEGDAGRRRVRTIGLRKFGSPDLFVGSVPPDLTDDVAGLLRDIAEHLSQGDLLGADEVIDYGIGKIRLVAAPPLEPGDSELLALADDVPEGAAPDAKAGIPKVLESMKKEREEFEGKRAGGGKGLISD